jgi:hypothetical protein
MDRHWQSSIRDREIYRHRECIGRNRRSRSRNLRYSRGESESELRSVSPPRGRHAIYVRLGLGLGVGTPCAPVEMAVGPAVAGARGHGTEATEPSSPSSVRVRRRAHCSGRDTSGVSIRPRSRLAAAGIRSRSCRTVAPHPAAACTRDATSSVVGRTTGSPRRRIVNA